MNAILRAAVAPHHQAMRAGSGRLVVQRVDGASSVTISEATDPLKFLVSTPRAACAWAFSTTYGGGLIAGDRIEMDIEVAAGAQLYLGTQASTKVYRSDGPVARQEFTAKVGAGGLLVALPDPVTPFATARFHQTQSIDCAASADLVWLDGVTCGRAARDERWDFTSYISSLELRVDGCPRLRDVLRLEAGLRSIRARLPEVEAMATLIVGGPGMSGLCAQLQTAVAAQPLAHQPRLTLSPLGAWGVLLRAATVEREQLEQTVRHLLGPLCPRLGDDPWQRRP
jgi:urease accessory protein